MANTYSKIQVQREVLDKLYNRYTNVMNKTKLFGEPLTDGGNTPTTTLPTSNYQAIYEQKVEYDKNDPNPQLITIKDLQKAINYMEGRFSFNCNCTSVPQNCKYTISPSGKYIIYDDNGNEKAVDATELDSMLSCQTQCSNDQGNAICQSCQYIADKKTCQSYACQTLTCQTVSSKKSCQACQSCQECQSIDKNFSCQSCQMFSCQTLRCEGAMAQCACQECETNCSQCSCQSIGYYNSCQSQCK